MQLHLIIVRMPTPCKCQLQFYGTFSALGCYRMENKKHHHERSTGKRRTGKT